jgi:thiopurine S-methyltransferase
MKSYKFDQSYWESKYQNNHLGWDMGSVSPPIQKYIDQLTDKEISILIPGAGNSYEAEYLFNLGFKNITVLDIAKQPLDNLQKRIPNFPKDHLIQADFFDHQIKYDLIIEQTFFCSLMPGLRIEYVKKINSLLTVSGKIIGVLFDFPLTTAGPPYGGSLEEYRKTFSGEFKIIKLERCYNSIKPRDGKELFIIFDKKSINKI